MIRHLLRGAAAGAAGTTALNAATYLDMAYRARPSSSTPQDTVEKAAAKAHIGVPGDGEERDHRMSALGSLTGVATGVGIGAMYGLARAAGLRLPTWMGVMLTSCAALVGSNGPMTALGVTDPRAWSAVDWVSDILPHLAYGAVTALTLADAES